jgi:hypothetical protein
VTARVYVPTGLDGLASLLDEGVLAASPDAVLAPDDDEETEYAALMTAAASCPDPRRRVVVVAEVADPDGPVRLDQVVAVHADGVARAPGADPDDDLAWYALTELRALLHPETR